MPTADPRLHSRYDPGREAERFVASCGVSFNPFCVVITEPGESYLAGALRKRFPSSLLVALRYDSERFSDSDPLWDTVWRPGKGVPLTGFLFNLIPDECLPLTAFLPWKPSDAAWPQAAESVWQDIASVIRTQASVMRTRDHFGKRWFSNMIRNAALARSFVTAERGSLPILLAAAGPSLESLPDIPHRSMRVYAVSAAAHALLGRGITPDLCIATDGGFWAKDHFRGIPGGIPVAFPLEAAIPSAVLENNPVALLDYGSLLERDLCALCGFTGAKAFRNGTVSGTAALFALDRTDGPVYASGLDLAPSKSFSHARPHVSDNPLAASAGRLSPLALTLFERNADTASLDMYAAWFSSRDSAFRNRFRRLEPSYREIAGIITVRISDVMSRHACQAGGEASTGQERPQFIPCPVPDRRTRQSRIENRLLGLAAEVSPFAASISDIAAYDSFIGGMFRDPLWSEVFQLVSYTDYIGVLKSAGSTEDRKVEDVSRARELCAKTLSFLGKLADTVRAYG